MAPAAPGLAANLSRAVFFCHCFLPAGGAERRRFRRPGARAGSMDPRSRDPQKLELADFDLSRIEEQDPSLIDDFKYVLPRALPRRGGWPAPAHRRPPRRGRNARPRPRALLTLPSHSTRPPRPRAAAPPGPGDPGNGARSVIFDREVPFELRVQQASEGPSRVGTLEAIKCKMLIQGDEHQPSAVRVELSSEADLFFHYSHMIDETGFRAVQEQQKLMVEFADYPNVLIRMFNNCIREPHNHLAVFVMQQDGSARLDFIQNMEYKFVELMSCAFARSGEESVQHHITYRYNLMKSRLVLMQRRLTEVQNFIKTKNPSLMLQFQKQPSMAGGVHLAASRRA